MSSKLLLCVSQSEVMLPYKFQMTNISVYSFEEALYHCYHYWKQSIDDIVSEDFCDWIGEGLKLSFLASRIREISRIQNLTIRFVSFLTLTDYFDRQQLDSLSVQISEWEQRLEWEKLKERGDYLMRRGEPEAALGFYIKALNLGENIGLLNNASIALMQLECFDEAIVYLRKAHGLDKADISVIENLAEAYIYNLDFDNAILMLNIAEKMNPKSASVCYLQGEMFFETGNYDAAIECFNTAIDIENTDHYVYRLADAYVRQRQYDAALSALERTVLKDKNYLVKIAEIQYKSNNTPAAIKTIKQAISANRDDVNLWTLLAYYHRLDYDLLNAGNAIIRAVALAPDNERAKLENARIKKAQGKIKDYQVILREILSGIKRRYREE